MFPGMSADASFERSLPRDESELARVVELGRCGKCGSVSLCGSVIWWRKSPDVVASAADRVVVWDGTVHD